MRITEIIPASTIQTSLKIKLSARREANQQWQERGPWAWGELIQQSKQLRSRIIGGNAGCPTHYQSYKTKQKCWNRKNVHREKEQSSKHQTQSSDHGGKILMNSSIYKHETNYNRLSHRKELWPNRAIHRWTNQPGLIENKFYSMVLKFLRLSALEKWLSASLYRQEDRPPLPHQLSPKHKKLFPGLQH